MNGEMSFLVVMLPLRVYVCCKCSMYLGTLRCPLFLSSFADPQHLPYCCSSMFRVVLADSVTHLTFIGFVASLEVSKWISGFCSEFVLEALVAFLKAMEGRWWKMRYRRAPGIAVSPERDNFDSSCKVKRRSKRRWWAKQRVWRNRLRKAELNKDRSAWCHDAATCGIQRSQTSCFLQLMQHIFEQSQMSWIDVLCNTKIQNPKIETVWVSYVDVSKNYSSAGGLGIQCNIIQWYSSSNACKSLIKTKGHKAENGKLCITLSL